MASKKRNVQQVIEDYSVDDDDIMLEPGSVDQDFVEVKEKKPKLKRDLPAAELELRELKHMFKAKFGYKPAGVSLDELREIMK